MVESTAHTIGRTIVDLSLSSRTDGDKTVIEVGGEIDVYTAPKLRERIVDLVDAGSYDLVIDMEQVEFLDSTGLGVLVGGLKRVRARHQVAAAGIHDGGEAGITGVIAGRDRIREGLLF